MILSVFAADFCFFNTRKIDIHSKVVSVINYNITLHHQSTCQFFLEEKSQAQIKVEMLELDKKKMGERLYNLQEASQLKAQQAQV